MLLLFESGKLTKDERFHLQIDEKKDICFICPKISNNNMWYEMIMAVASFFMNVKVQSHIPHNCR